MQTTDVHGHLLPFDYARDRPRPKGSLVQAADVIEDLRSEGIPTLLFDCGDMLQGSPLAAPPTSAGHSSAVIAAMNRLGYDAATLGNHDLDHGPASLARALRQARFPVVASNLGPPITLATLLHPSLILRCPLACDPKAPSILVGLVGVLPPQVDSWSHGPFDPPLSTTGIVKAASRTGQALRRDGADLIVVLSHSGQSCGEGAAQAENAADLLRELDEVDVVLAGHTHQVTPAPGRAETFGPDETPLVAAGAFAMGVGVIDIELARTADRGWAPLAATSRVIPTETRAGTGPLAQAIRDDLAPTHVRVRRRQNKILRGTGHRLTSHFSMVMPDLAQACLATAIRSEADRLMQDHPLADLPRLVAVPPMSAGGLSGPDNFLDTCDGTLRRRHVEQLFPFPNPVVLVALTGVQVIDWLERSVSVFERLDVGRRCENLLRTDAASYNFDVFHGLHYQIDLSQPARFSAAGDLQCETANRITEVMIGDRPLGELDRVVVATSSYRSAGGGRVRALDRTDPIARSLRPIPAVLEDWAQGAGWALPQVLQHWRFRRLPGTLAEFVTAPGAREENASHPGLVRSTGQLRNGFALFELDLDPPSLANPDGND